MSRQLWAERVWKKHDCVRYKAFLQECVENIRSGRRGKGVASIKTDQILPHTVCQAAFDSEEPGDIEHDLQWKGIKDAFRNPGNSIAVCDVSGSMEGIPMMVAVGLSMLLAETAPRSSPFFGKLIPFAENPALFDFSESIPPPLQDGSAGLGEAGDLRERVHAIRDMDWGASTDFDKVFDLVLGLCRANSVSSDDVGR